MTRKTKTDRSPRQTEKAVAKTVSALLEALGHTPRGPLKETPARVAELWTHKLLAGEHYDFDSLLERSSPTTSTSPISVLDIGIHIVCPHHLTVAFGKAHVAYVPKGRILGFGAIADLVTACTARLILQEDATDLICQSLVEHFEAKAAVATIEATHPCLNLTHPRAHSARVVSWASHGHKGQSKELRALLKRSIQ